MMLPLDPALDASPDRIGGKAASLLAMARLGLPVPPAFVLPTEVARHWLATGAPPAGLARALQDGLAFLEGATGRRFGAGPVPLLLAIRSGAPVSMPGMMDTLLNLGLTDATVAALNHTTGDPGFGADLRAAFTRQFTELVGPVPEDPFAQLVAAVEAVFASWNSRRARRYRAHHGIAGDLGTAVTVQAMVFGTLDDRSGTGVLFSRNPIDENPEPWGEWLPRAQGEALVAGTRDPLPLASLADALPEVSAALAAALGYPVGTKAAAAFGDGRIYLEPFVEAARHVEVQAFGLGDGRVLTLGTRDCSIQRRYQKLVGEAPAAAVPAAASDAMEDAARCLLAGIAYRGAGTVEFLWDEQRQSFRFLEVNARIQVEHPVTEERHGIDLVAWQVAQAFDRLGTPEVPSSEGHAIEVRILAEDEAFRPAPGTITRWEEPPHVRIDSGYGAGATVPPHYDSLLAKLVVHAATRTEAVARLARVAKEFGAEVAAALMFTLSPVHTDACYAGKARALAALPEVGTLLLYDTAGVLEKERLQTLLPAIVAESRGKPIEFHSSNLLGQSAKACCDSLALGVSILHTASRPMANGPSVPSTERLVANLAHLGHDHDVSQLPPVAAHFEAVGRACGFPVHQHAEYDLFAVTHQIPGGMVGTLRAQLRQHGLEDRLADVLAEVARVRRELGWPGMATPFSQLVGIQAVPNIVTGTRWSIIPEDVIAYAAGHYGQPVAPIDPDILDRIMADPKARSVLANPPEQPTLAELRRRHGTDDDDELFLRALIPEADIARMRAAGPLVTRLPLASSAEADTVIRLLSTLSSRHFRIATERVTVEVAR